MSDAEDIKSRLNIVDVLGEYIRLEKSGANFKALCPFHNEKNPSFMVSEEKQIWHCFGCQKGGDIFSFVMELEGLEFRESLKILAEKAGIELQKNNPAQTNQRNKILEILELSTKFYETQLWKGEGTQKVLPYLKERGLTDDSIKNFRLGYAPRGWKNLLQFLIGRGYIVSDIEKTGLLVNKDSSALYDRFRDRIIFSIGDVNGKIIGFSARVAPGGNESQAKYVNTPETSVYHKGKVLYGIEKAKSEIRKEGVAFLVEGNMDVIASHQAGIKNTVAVSGTALTSDQIQILKRYVNKIKIGFDMDTAGESATKKSIQLCFLSDIAVEVVEFPGGKDAADIVRNDPATLIQSVQSSRSAMEYFFQKVTSKHDISTAEGKSAIASDLLEMISYMSNAIEREHWIKKIAQSLQIGEHVLTDALKQAILKDRAYVHKDSSDRINQFVSKKRIETLIEDLCGLMLSHFEVWKEMEKNHAVMLDSLGNNLLLMLVETGKRAGYSAQALIDTLADRDLAAKIEKIFFAYTYRLGLNNQLEEIVVEDPLREAVSCLGEIKKEMKKELLNKIIRDLKIAEEGGDKEAMSLLHAQCKKVFEENEE